MKTKNAICTRNISNNNGLQVSIDRPILIELLFLAKKKSYFIAKFSLSMVQIFHCEPDQQVDNNNDSQSQRKEVNETENN